ncbi:MAG TPA: hypothetical protein VNZ68_04865 [Rhodocyclaceae bacterium]|nr:hypothetical protein [Rhodocyclaceae bacterium]
MHSHFSSAQIEQLRRQAKQLKKTTDISLNQAQDLIAQRNGWSNWSLLMKNRLPEPASAFPMRKIKNRYDAENAFCELIVDAGRAVGAPSFSGDWEGEDEPLAQHNGDHHLTENTLDAICECEFGDPHFIGGPAIFNFAQSVAQVNRIFERAEPVVSELALALQQVNPDQASQFRVNLQSIRDWMLRTC